MSMYSELSKEQLTALKGELEQKMEEYKAMNLSLNMARGKPGSDQLDLSNDLMYAIHESKGFKSEDGTDCRNYGGLEGITEMRRIFGEILGMPEKNVILCGNSSLNVMFDFITQCMITGIAGCEPWMKQGKVKFLCPVPGYDRHFSICEYYGIEMINVPMSENGPDMDMVESLVSSDPSVKGIWCVPMYSNPTGVTYSDETVRRFAALKPAAKDFRIIWDNAYVIHHLYDETDSLLSLFDECKKTGNDDLPIVLASTSKVSFSGAGISCIGASDNNIKELKSRLNVQTIGPDKINQLRHVRFYKDTQGFLDHMKKHAAILRPKFETVIGEFEKGLGGLGIAKWTTPKGGYFVSFDSLPGCASKIHALCSEAGVTLTPSGATYPYGKDPQDCNLRIAPTFPSLDELEKALEVFITAVKLVSAEKYLADMA